MQRRPSLPCPCNVVATATFAAIRSNSDGFGPRYTLKSRRPRRKTQSRQRHLIRIRPRRNLRRAPRTTVRSPPRSHPARSARNTAFCPPAIVPPVVLTVATQTHQRNRRRPSPPAPPAASNATLNVTVKLPSELCDRRLRDPELLDPVRVEHAPHQRPRQSRLRARLPSTVPSSPRRPSCTSIVVPLRRHLHASGNSAPAPACTTRNGCRSSPSFRYVT